MAERDVIITNSQVVYSEWKWKFAILASFVNYIIRELPKKLQEADEVMCPENMSCQVFNFVKFCKKTLEGFTTDLVTIRRDQGV